MPPSLPVYKTIEMKQEAIPGTSPENPFAVVLADKVNECSRFCAAAQRAGTFQMQINFCVDCFISGTDPVLCGV